jgi:hypothetical protein
MRLFNICCAAFLTIATAISAQYTNNSQLSVRIGTLGQKKDLVNVASVVKTAGGHNVFQVTIGKGDTGNKPGIAFIGGIKGSSLFSTEVIVQIMEKMIRQDPSILDEVTFYFFPDVTPDASGQYFAPVTYEREENARSYDDDRDGQKDEDGYDDLNHDGMITRMRIKDPEKGDYMVHPDNAYVMVKADITKNQKAEYRIMSEGLDNDNDGEINEDLPGGIIFNKNFTYNYPYFSPGAGENAFSEEESRALAKFLFDHWNIFAVVCIGQENNLTVYSDLKTELIDKNLPSAVHEKDKPYFESIINLYKDFVRLSDTAAVIPTGGDLLSWAYFHYNRFAFSTPAWNFSKNKNNMGSAEFDYLKWASDHGLQDQTVPWQNVDHPDFPGKVVEVGGIKPFVMFNPPLTMVDTVSQQHLDFLIALASMRPVLTFNDVKITKRANDVFMLEAEITNSGKCPTMPAMAIESNWIKMIRLDILTSKAQQVTGGRKVFLFDRIIPGETVKAAWLISGKGKVILKAGSPQTGFVTREIELN